MEGERKNKRIKNFKQKHLNYLKKGHLHYNAIFFLRKILNSTSVSGKEKIPGIIGFDM